MERRTSVHFRFGEFCRIVDDQIIEIRVLVDLIDLLRQVGDVLPPQPGGRA